MVQSINTPVKVVALLTTWMHEVKDRYFHADWSSTKVQLALDEIDDISNQKFKLDGIYTTTEFW